MPSPRSVVAAFVALLAAVAVVVPATAATAAPNGDLLYSTDGGATWSTSASLAPNGSVLVRQWFDNDGDDVVDDASVTSSRPADLSLVPGSTTVCLNPTSANPATPDEAELACAAAHEAAAWTGTELALAPSAGHFGVGAGTAVGPLAPGRKRYLNLRQGEGYFPSGVVWQPGPVQTLGAVTQWDSNDPRMYATTSAGNDLEPWGGANYAGSNLAWVTPLSGFANLPLFGQRWLNLDECHWRSPDGRVATSYLAPQGAGGAMDPAAGWMVDGSAFTADTGTAREGDSPEPACGTGDAGWTLDGTASAAMSLDILNHRYLRLQQCRWQTIEPVGRGFYSTVAHNVAGDEAHGTTTSDTPSDLTTFGCGNPDPDTYEEAPRVRYHAFSRWFDVAQTGAMEIDLLDPARARGFVQYELKAGANPTPEACTAGLPGNTQSLSQPGALEVAGSPVATSSGALTVDWSAVLAGDPCPGNATPLVDPVVGLVAGGAAVIVATAARRRRRVAA